MKKNFFYALLTMLLIGCASQYPELENGLYADIETNKGSIVVSLELEKTPITVANFVSLSEGENDLVSACHVRACAGLLHGLVRSLFGHQMVSKKDIACTGHKYSW